MKKFNYWLSVLLVGVLSILYMPNVMAATIEFGEASEPTSSSTVPIYVNLDANEELNSVELGCKAEMVVGSQTMTNSDLKCKIESAITDSEGWTIKNESNYVHFQYAVSEAPEASPTGDSEEPTPQTHGYKPSESTKLHIANLIVENKSSSAMTVAVALARAKFNGEDKNVKATSFSLKAVVSEKPKSDDATLKELKFSQGSLSPAFSPDVEEYTLYNIADTVNSTTYSYKCNEGTCSINLAGVNVNGFKIQLNQGLNTAKFTIKSESGKTSKVYTVNIYRGQTSFNSARLSALSFGQYTMSPAFSPDITEYTIIVPNKVNNLNNIIQYTSEDDKATVEVTGLDNFKVGANTIKIAVKSASEEETITYKVTVNRLTADGITVTKYKDDKVTYKESDGTENTLASADFKARYPEEWTKIEDGTYKFDNDGNITTGEEEDENKDNEDESEDKDEEKEQKEGSDKKLYLIIGLIALGLLIIIIAGVIIFKKKKDSDDEEDDDNSEDSEEDEDEEDTPEEPIGEDFSDDVNKTVDVDVALNDLMSTKQYEFNFDDEEEVPEEKKEEEE